MNNVELGQEAAIHRKGEYVFGYKVTKITPTGQVTITGLAGGTRRFNASGIEIGGNSVFTTTLIVGAQKIAEAQHTAKLNKFRDRVVVLVRQVMAPAFNSSDSIESLEIIINDLDKSLNAAKLALVEAKAVASEKE